MNTKRNRGLNAVALVKASRMAKSPKGRAALKEILIKSGRKFDPKMTPEQRALEAYRILESETMSDIKEQKGKAFDPSMTFHELDPFQQHTALQSFEGKMRRMGVTHSFLGGIAAALPAIGKAAGGAGGANALNSSSGLGKSLSSIGNVLGLRKEATLEEKIEKHLMSLPAQERNRQFQILKKAGVKPDGKGGWYAPPHVRDFLQKAVDGQLTAQEINQQANKLDKQVQQDQAIAREIKARQEFNEKLKSNLPMITLVIAALIVGGLIIKNK